jgi:hypothetical protein
MLWSSGPGRSVLALRCTARCRAGRSWCGTVYGGLAGVGPGSGAVQVRLGRRAADQARAAQHGEGGQLRRLGGCAAGSGPLGSFLVARTTQHREYLRREMAQSVGRRCARGECGAAGRWGQLLPGRWWGIRPVVSRRRAYRRADEPDAGVRGRLQAARAVVLENEPVVGISVTDGRLAGVETSGRSIATPVVVDAAGGWLRQVAELAGAQCRLPRCVTNC